MVGQEPPYPLASYDMRVSRTITLPLSNERPLKINDYSRREQPLEQEPAGPYSAIAFSVVYVKLCYFFFKSDVIEMLL